MTNDLILTALRAYIDMTSSEHKYALLLQSSNTVSIQVTAGMCIYIYIYNISKLEEESISG